MGISNLSLWCACRKHWRKIVENSEAEIVMSMDRHLERSKRLALSRIDRIIRNFEGRNRSTIFILNILFQIIVIKFVCTLFNVVI
jgi:hypothetical protein